MSSLFILILFIVLAIYSLLILYYTAAFIKLKPFVLANNKAPKTAFTIIIPARNEAENIVPCLQSILQNDYPALLVEIIVIDDFSEDDTVVKIKQLQTQFPQIKLLQLKDYVDTKPINSYKKKALALAINQAAGDWIITTDADCIVPKTWLSSFDAYIQQNNKIFVAAPVMFTDAKNFLSRFQCLDFLSLQGITAASVSAGVHSMCNGANLCYQKSTFYDVGGFAGIDNVASGDDMLLMRKMQKKYPEGIGYLFSQQSIVHTLPMPDWRSFINQRIRWASKTTNYDDWRMIAVLALVYLLNLFILILFVLAFFFSTLWIYWIVCIITKTIAECIFMQKVCRFYHQSNLLKWFPIMQPLHILYTVIAGFLGTFGKYQWKNRTVK